MKQESIMWEYIAQEPELLSVLMRDPTIAEYAGRAAYGLKSVYLVAHGSSYNAAVTISNFMAQCTGLRVYAYTPSIFEYGQSSLQLEEIGSSLVIAISQTGTSSGAIQALKHAKKLGVRTLSLTGAAGSPVAEEADDVLMLHCGREDSNAKTKGYSCTLLLLSLLSLELGLALDALSEAAAEACLAELTAQIAQIDQVVDKVLGWCRRTGFGSRLENLYSLGYGLHFGTALEAQLKLMETMCIPTMFNDLGEFSHGMHRAIDSHSSVLLLRGQGELDELMLKTYSYLLGITENVLMLDVSGNCEDSDNCISLPCYPLTQSLLLMTAAIQTLSVFAPEYCGMDPNRDAHNDFTAFVSTRV